MRIPVQVKSNGESILGIMHITDHQQQKPVILIMCYGLNGNRTEQHRLSVQLGIKCENNGLNLIRFDYSNCGVNNGNFIKSTQEERINNVLDIISFVKNCFQCNIRIFLIGFCDGAKIAIKVANIVSTIIDGIIFWNPSVRSKYDITSNRKSTHTKLIIHPKYQIPCVQFAGVGLNLLFFNQLKNDNSENLINCIDCDICSIFGEFDRRSAGFKKYLKEKSKIDLKIYLKTIKNAGHLFNSLEEIEEVTNQTIEWILKIIFDGGKCSMGLDRKKVQLVAHDANWDMEYSKEKNILIKGLSKYIDDIQHVGSTSIENLKAKPIIDIAILLNDWDKRDEICIILENLGYEYRPKAGTPDRIFFAKGNETNRTHYLHVCKKGSQEWLNLIDFRDYLNKHKNKMEEYQKLKERLAERFPDDRKKYTEGKDKFIKSIINSRKVEKDDREL